MKVLFPKNPGLTHQCETCGALLMFTIEDIVDKQYLMCPVCQRKQKCALDLSYDGVIKNGSVSKEQK